MSMVWLAVNQDGQELCSSTRLFRHHKAINELIEKFEYDHYRIYLNNDDHWCNNFSEGYFTVPRFTGVILPQGSIKKLIGRELTWNDESVKLE